jgi:hypothetical protein
MVDLMIFYFKLNIITHIFASQVVSMRTREVAPTHFDQRLIRPSERYPIRESPPDSQRLPDVNLPVDLAGSAPLLPAFFCAVAQ